MSDNNSTVLVEILNGTSQGGGGWSSCGSAGSCGTNPYEELQEIAEKLTDELKTAYGEKVEVKYINADNTGLADYPLVSRVLQMGYPYPITIINGEPKFAGGIMGPDIKSSIDEILNQ